MSAVVADYISALTGGFWRESAPTKPTLELVDKADGTGFTAIISDYTPGTTNTLYVGQPDGTFESKGSTWVDDEMDVEVEDGRWYAYVVSDNGVSTNVSDIEAVMTTGGGSEAATDNIPVAKRAMKQIAVYWEQAGVDAFGKPTYSAPDEIGCRWEDTEEEFVTPNGDREMSRAKLIVDRDLEVKGVLWLGRLADVSDRNVPKNNAGAWEILLFKKTPDFRGKKFLREVYLSWSM